MIAIPRVVPEPRPKHYVLSGKKAVPCSMEQWVMPFESKNRHVGDTTIGGVRVSTVFLGIDHNWSPDGPPLIFETMVFRGPFDEEMQRYSTWEEAEHGHAKFVKAVTLSQTLNGRMRLLRFAFGRMFRSITNAIRNDAARLWRWIRSCWR